MAQTLSYCKCAGGRSTITAEIVPKSDVDVCAGAAAWHNAAHACHHYGRRRRHAFVSVDEGPRETGGSTWWEKNNPRNPAHQLLRLRLLIPSTAGPISNTSPRLAN